MINEAGRSYTHDDMEWQRKTCRHTIGLIRDEQMLLNVALHQNVVEVTFEVIDILLNSVKEEWGEKSINRWVQGI
jgi:hypothetical protein